MSIDTAKKANWPNIIYYKRTNGHIRNTNGRGTIAKISKELKAREVEFKLAKDLNQIYKYNDDLTIKAFLKGGFWQEMTAFDRVDAPNKNQLPNSS